MADPISLVARPFLSEIFRIVSSLISGEYSLIHGVKEDLERLSSHLTSIKAVLEDAEKKQLNQQHLKDWLEKLQEVVFDAEDVLDTFATDAKVRRRFQTPLSNTAYKHDVANKIKVISRRFDVISTEKERFHLNSQVDVGKLETPNHTVFHMVQSDVVGRDADKENIINMMLSNEYDREGDVSVIPIIGMGGLGKTTLAQFIFNDEKIAHHFESRMWICVTVDFNPTRILKEMIQFHSKVKLDESSESHLHSRLLEFLREQRFLLVLDDFWLEDYNRWDQSLLGLLRNGAKGSRVLVTSRNTRVVIATLPPYNLSYLSEDDCWSLFSRIVCRNGSLPENLERIGRTIIGKCKGLPLAVKAMAGILLNHTDDVNKWKQIQNHEIWEIEEQEQESGFDRFKIMAILKFSYDHLPYYLKHCFAYCSIFPKAYAFNKKELVKYWIAQGIIQSRGRDTMEETGIAHFHELTTRSFFQLSNTDDKDIYIMHDLMHDLALSISSPNCCQVKDNDSWNFSKQPRHLSLLGKDLEQPMLQIVKNDQKLRSLLFPSEGLKSFSNQVLENLFRTLKYLRLLDLSSSVILVLPDSIEELKLLRYLDLSRTEIKVLPDSICNLYNLQALKLQGCLWLSGLPKNLGNLVNLRHLDLEDMFWFKYSSKLPPRMGNLTNLHNLHAFRVGNENGYRIEELKNMEHLSKTLHISNLENAVNAGEAKLNEKKNLDKLTFEWSDRVPNTQDEAAERSVLEDLQPHPDLKELQVFRYGGNEFPTWMSEGRLQNLVKVTLDGCVKCKTLTIGDRLPNLKELYMKRMLELEKWPEVDCHSLRRLKFSNCPNLRELPSIFPSLNVMKIKVATP
ncbi:putative disease resistance protein RGA3 [Juglans microcarpa x Juglans regia]|uniref:putative disease resistance protein RGA3 n=1 Tax=Juglans microcarpa x Juglans regia TaxID=2249226 RepID=UPI001B7E1399|nr:putative disease resistance protein RGA3 [Juglans microcarpa x Juglans regia]